MKIPKQYKDQIELIEAESGLIDDCNYMVYLKKGWMHYWYGVDFPIKDSKELHSLMLSVDVDYTLTQEEKEALIKNNT